jgi:hypothetical protein
MEKKKLSLMMLAIFCLSACSDDSGGYADVDGQAPLITLTSAHVRTETGRTFRIEGKVEDRDGIRSIRLRNAELELDKTIDLLAIYDELLYAYDLDYKFKIPNSFSGDNLNLQVTVADVGGRTAESALLITMDGDFTPPVFTAAPDNAITVLIKEETRLNLKFTVEDDKALDYVEISLPEIDYSRKIAADGKVLQFSDPLVLPSAQAVYNLTITATDKFQFSTQRKSTITVSEMPDFEKMYLVDVSEASRLNSDIFGIPMLIDRVDPYTYRARYYSEAPGTPIRFIPQKTDFNPICFGVDPDDNTILTDEPDRSLPILLPAGKQYYEISFNTRTGEYAFDAYTPEDAPLNIGAPVYLDAGRPEEGTIPLEIGLVGAGLPNSGNWNPAEPYMLKQDAGNPYLFTAEISLEAGTEVGFIIQSKHSWGWWPEPFWRWNTGDDPEYNIPNGGENPATWRIGTTGRYLFKFDTHLLRSAFYPL